MRDGGSLRLRAGLGRFLEAMIAALVVLVALVASALGQTSVQSSVQTSGQTSVQTSGPASGQASGQSSDQASIQASNPSPGQDSGSAQAAPIQRPAHAARKPFRAARLSYFTGNVIVEQARSKTQDVAVMNMPLVEGSVISTGDDGQAEIEFEDGSLVRVTPNSGVSLLNLSVDGDGIFKTRVAILDGLVYAELRAGTKYQYSIDARGDVVTPAENATIRVNLDEPPASIAVLQGSAHITSVDGNSSIAVQAGQTARADSEQDASLAVKEEIVPETWDQWNEDRDQVAAGETGTQTAARDQYAGDQGYGWSDLDANGSWYNLPGQGGGQGAGQGAGQGGGQGGGQGAGQGGGQGSGQNLIWQPDIAEDSGADATGDADAGGGFDPYGDGSWVWTPAGYSWASSYGWGWLPYRCGQWLYVDQFGWGWQPGTSCGAFGFGGYGFGGFGLGVNIGRTPRLWRRPVRPVPGPSPVHPIIHGRGLTPLVESQANSSGRLIRVKTIGGRSIEPLPPLTSASVPRYGSAMGSALRRDYPLNAATREPVLGVVPTHTVQANGRVPGQPSEGFAPPRSYRVPAVPNYYGGAVQRAAPVVRSAPAPAQHASPSPASHPSSSSPAATPHK